VSREVARLTLTVSPFARRDADARKGCYGNPKKYSLIGCDVAGCRARIAREARTSGPLKMARYKRPTRNRTKRVAGRRCATHEKCGPNPPRTSSAVAETIIVGRYAPSDVYFAAEVFASRTVTLPQSVQPTAEATMNAAKSSWSIDPAAWK
jgi:hypothetical protein